MRGERGTGGAEPAAGSGAFDRRARAALRRAVLAWFDGSPRGPLPWRRLPRDAYRAWVAEALLQQTRAATAAPYYERFIGRFPTPQDLAAADPEEVLRVWQGLGYYHRARALQRGVREVVERYGGAVPAEPQAFGALPGVGPYTTGAVLSIAYGARLPAVDGNVRRVLARLSAEAEPIDGPGARRRLEALASELVPADRPGDWNEALMDLGALVCLPRRPRCGACPAATRCRARAGGLTADIPRRSPRRSPVTVRVATVAARAADGRWCLVRRPDRGLLAGLWQFPSAGEDGSGATPAAALARHGLRAARPPSRAGRLTHVFSHRIWEVSVWRCRALEPLPAEDGALRWLPLERLGDVPATAVALKAARLLPPSG